MVNFYPAISVLVSKTVRSTPSTDKRPTHVTGNELELALKALEGEASAFADMFIRDSGVRKDYMSKTAAARQELIAMVQRGELTPHEAAQTANAMRNQIMDLARSNLSEFGLAHSKELKASGRLLDYMEAKKARELFSKEFHQLTHVEREKVWVQIVDSAGKSNKKVNLRVKWMGGAGRVLLVATLAFAVYNVATAEDKPRQAAKEGTAVAGGVAGAAAATAVTAALVSNPAGWTVLAVMFVGAAVGGAGSSAAFDYFWPEKRQ